MSAAAILAGMPEPSDLRLHRTGGRCVITAGSVVLFAYGESDVVMRNLAISALRRLGFTGRRVAAVMGLTENYVATLHAGAMRDGSAALIRRPGPGRPGKLGGQDRADAAAWRAAGLTDTEIGQRLGVAHTTVARRLGSKRRLTAEAPGPAGPAAPARDEPEPAVPGQHEPAAADPAGDAAAAGPGSPPGRSRPGTPARCCCTRSPALSLLYACVAFLAGVAGSGGFAGCADPRCVSTVIPHDLELLFMYGLGVLGCRALSAASGAGAGAHG